MHKIKLHKPVTLKVIKILKQFVIYTLTESRVESNYLNFEVVISMNNILTSATTVI